MIVLLADLAFVLPFAFRFTLIQFVAKLMVLEALCYFMLGCGTVHCNI